MNKSNKQEKITSYLHIDDHGHILQWLKGQDNTAAAIRAALEFYIQHQTGMAGDKLEGQVIDKQVITEAIAGALVRPEFIRMIRTAVDAAVQEVLGSIQLKALPTEATRDDDISLEEEIGGNFISG